MSTTGYFSFAIGIGAQNKKGEWLDIYYQKPLLNPSDALISAATKATGHNGGNAAIDLSKEQLSVLANALQDAGESTQAELAAKLQSTEQPVVVTFIETDEAPNSVPECYLKLHLLTHRLVKPHGTNLTGLFGVLPNVAWTNEGAIAIDELADRQLDARMKGGVLEVSAVDKFPKMTNYFVPPTTRIADTDRVRLGAHLGDNTTVMHEGFINFNAGTLGASMIEGRISSGVVVGKGSDLGGGCSTMGTLSGGGNIVISVGEESLIGANSGLGIPLGDRCIIESGLYITAGTKIMLLDEKNQDVEIVKGRDLAAVADLIFRRNSLTGRVEAKTNKTAIQLNEALHANN